MVGWKKRLLTGALVGTGCLAMAALPARAGWLRSSCCRPAVVCPPECTVLDQIPAVPRKEPEKSTEPDTERREPTVTETPPAAEGFRPPAGPGEMVSTRMLGNDPGPPRQTLPVHGTQGPSTQPGPPPPTPGPPPMQPSLPLPPAVKQQVAGAVVVPSVRGFRISEDENPRPEDRVYFGFNYFDHVNESINRRFGADLRDLRVYRETFGIEKTFLDGEASIGLRLPLNTLSADSSTTGLGGTSTDVGDLTIISKFALWQEPRSGDFVSAGLAVTAPTGPDSFAGARGLTSFHDTILEPFMGYVFSAGNWYVLGFSGLDVPTESRDVTVLFNDIGVGYFLTRTRDNDRFVTAVAPTLEMHVNTPLNHRGALRLSDPAGLADGVSLTTGITFELNGRSTLAVGLVTPVTGPRPYDFEVLAQVNFSFGWRGTPGPRGIGY